MLSDKRTILPYAPPTTRPAPNFYIIAAFCVWAAAVAGSIAIVSSVSSKNVGIGGYWSMVGYFNRVHAAEQMSLRMLAIAAAVGLTLAILGRLEAAGAKRIGRGARALTVLVIINACTLLLSAAAIAMDVPKLKEFSIPSNL